MISKRMSFVATLALIIGCSTKPPDQAPVCSTCPSPTERIVYRDPPPSPMCEVGVPAWVDGAWKCPDAPPPPPPLLDASAEKLRGNFMAAEGYDFETHLTIPYRLSKTSLGWTSFTPEERHTFLASYAANDYNIVPVTFTPRQEDWSDVCWSCIDTYMAEIREHGLMAMSFLITDDLANGRRMSFDEAERWARALIPRIDAKNVIHVACWECPLYGPGEHWTYDDYKSTEFVEIIAEETDQPIAEHGQPRWWSGGTGWANGVEGDGYPDDRDWLRAHLEAADNSDYIWLMQSRWPAPAYDVPTIDPDDADNMTGQLDWVCRYEGAAAHTPGFLGRVINEGVQFVWFEFERGTDGWHEKEQLYYEACGDLSNPLIKGVM